jgi:hypothetical protein
MNEVDSPNNQFTDLLWQLKQALDRHSSHEGELIPYSHLVKDPHYRQEVIQQAMTSNDRETRTLGHKLKVLQQGEQRLADVLSGNTSSAPSAAGSATESKATGSDSGNQGSGSGRSRRSPWRPILIVAMAVLVLASVWYLRQDLRELLIGERTVRGSILLDTHWDANTIWKLEGVVYVEGNTTLTIDAGTRILGLPGSALIVTRPARLMSKGTAAQPVVFTSAKQAGTRARGDWGGVVLLGSAPINRASASIEGLPEGDTRGQFGGNDPTSNCGVVEYTRIEFAGYEAYKDNELNGLTLGACGSDTLIHHVQVHQALDDGIEVFGGAVDLRHILITGAADDSLDWDMGWTGRVQFLAVQQHDSHGDNAFEADSNKSKPDAKPVSHPVMYNVTLMSLRSSEKHQRAMTLRRGTAGDFHNLIIQGFSGELLDIRDAATVQNIQDGQLTLTHAMIYHIGENGRAWFADESGDKDDDAGFDELAWVQNPAWQNQFAVDPLLPRDASRLSRLDLTPNIRSPAQAGAKQPPQGEFWDEAAVYLGAFKPGAPNSWIDGWSDFPAR